MNNDELRTDLALLSADLPDLPAVRAAVGQRIATRTRRRRGIGLLATAAAVVAVSVGTVAVATPQNDAPTVSPPAVTSSATATELSSRQPVTTVMGGPATGAAATKPTAESGHNILLIGADTNPPAALESATIVHLGADGKPVVLLSIPADLTIPTPHCQVQTGVSPGQISPSSTGQQFTVETSYDIGGPRCTATALESLTGLRFEGVVGIDFTGFESLVDGLGGLDIDACSPIVDRAIGPIVAAAGQQHLSGAAALGLFRAENVIGETGTDNDRILRQQQVLYNTLRKVSAAASADDPSKLAALRQLLTQDITTVSGTDTSATLARQLTTASTREAFFYTLPHEATTRGSTINAAAARQVTDAIGADQDPPRDTVYDAAVTHCVGPAAR